MFSSKSTYYLNFLRCLILPFVIGLFVLGSGIARSAPPGKTISQAQLSITSADILEITSLSISGAERPGKISAENLGGDVRDLFLWLLTNDTTSEDERIYPQILPFSSSIQLVNNLTSQRLATAFLRYDFSDLSLKILSTVVFLH